MDECWTWTCDEGLYAVPGAACGRHWPGGAAGDAGAGAGDAEANAEADDSGAAEGAADGAAEGVAGSAEGPAAAVEEEAAGAGDAGAGVPFGVLDPEPLAPGNLAWTLSKRASVCSCSCVQAPRSLLSARTIRD